MTMNVFGQHRPIMQLAPAASIPKLSAACLGLSGHKSGKMGVVQMLHMSSRRKSYRRTLSAFILLQSYHIVASITHQPHASPDPPIMSFLVNIWSRFLYQTPPPMQNVNTTFFNHQKLPKPDQIQRSGSGGITLLSAGHIRCAMKPF